MSRHIVIAGGGTGGHLFPGVAVVEMLEKLRPDFRFSFVGSRRGIEARVVPELGYPLETVDVHPLKSGGLTGMFKGLASLPASGLRSVSHVRKLRPDLVIAVGGYAAGPFTLAASALGVPTVLMEQNARPGLTNGILGRFVRKAFVSFESTCEHLATRECAFVGNPVRRAIAELAEEFEYQVPEAGEPFHILVIGGSGGAHSLNVGVPAALKGLPEELQARVAVTHQAGRGRTDAPAAAYQGFGGHVEVVEFIDDMASAYRSCDLLVCRAGMSTIAEVTVLGLPALYVPLSSGDAHQEHNALAIAEAGGGMMLRDDQIGTERATRLLQGLIRNPEALDNVARRARELGRPEAAREIATACLELLQEA